MAFLFLSDDDILRICNDCKTILRICNDRTTNMIGPTWLSLVQRVFCNISLSLSLRSFVPSTNTSHTRLLGVHRVGWRAFLFIPTHSIYIYLHATHFSKSPSVENIILCTHDKRDSCQSTVMKLTHSKLVYPFTDDILWLLEIAVDSDSLGTGGWIPPAGQVDFITISRRHSIFY